VFPSIGEKVSCVVFATISLYGFQGFVSLQTTYILGTHSYIWIHIYKYILTSGSVSKVDKVTFFKNTKESFGIIFLIRELSIAVGKNVCLCFGDVPLKEW
jgi:hypothetical protein